jgi:hypothetical protein
MGAHPDLPAEAEADGKWVPLNALIDAHPIAWPVGGIIYFEMEDNG